MISPPPGLPRQGGGISFPSPQEDLGIFNWGEGLRFGAEIIVSLKYFTDRNYILQDTQSMQVETNSNQDTESEIRTSPLQRDGSSIRIQ